MSFPSKKSKALKAGRPAALKAGRPAKPASALTREPQAAPDSSDEEEERLLQLGAEGK